MPATQFILFTENQANFEAKLLNNTMECLAHRMKWTLLVMAIGLAKIANGSYGQEDSLTYKDSMGSYSPSYSHGAKRMGDQKQKSFSSSSYPQDLLYRKVFTSAEAGQMFRSAGCVNDEIKVKKMNYT